MFFKRAISAAYNSNAVMLSLIGIPLAPPPPLLCINAGQRYPYPCRNASVSITRSGFCVRICFPFPCTRISLPCTDLSRIVLLDKSVTKEEILFGAFAYLSHTVLLGPLLFQWIAVFLSDFLVRELLFVMFLTTPGISVGCSLFFPV